MIIEVIGTAAMLEQLAEECAELSHAALKSARILRKENPTPAVYKDTMKNVEEEFTDVYQCASELRLRPDIKQIKEKNERFLQRIEEMTACRSVTMPENRQLREAILDITTGNYLTKHEWNRIIEVIKAVAHRGVIREEYKGE